MLKCTIGNQTFITTKINDVGKCMTVAYDLASLRIILLYILFN